MCLKWELRVQLPPDTPVVGVELNPWFHVSDLEDSHLAPLNKSVLCTWYKELSMFCEHDRENETLQPNAAGYFMMCSSGDGLKQEKLSFLNAENSTIIDGEGKLWIKVGSSRTHIPSQDDIHSKLRLVAFAVNDMGDKMSPTITCITTPVIRPLRPMIQFYSKPFKDGSLSVLSYNILADLYTQGGVNYSHCPKWALTWEYRRQNLLKEILSYGADIICLQEVQSNHFENFFQPEFEKLGYSPIYKKKTKEVYSDNQYIIDGRATFFQHDSFNMVAKYEVEYDKFALPVIELLEQERKNVGSYRLGKDNVAVVVILEKKDSSESQDGFKSRICIANTHIHRGSDASDVRLFQTVNLIRGLEKIDSLGVPIVICGDFNSRPGSEPHRFLINGEVGPFGEEYKDPLEINKHLTLSHSMQLASAYAWLLDSDAVWQQQKGKMDYQSTERYFTFFRPNCTVTLDYILYSEKRLKVEGLLKPLDYDSTDESLLPSPLLSSDHVALMASFSIRRASEERPKFLPPPDPWKQIIAEMKVKNQCPSQIS